MIDYAVLKKEIEGGTLASSCKEWLAAGSDDDIARLFSDKAGSASGSVPVQSVSKATFIRRLVAPAAIALAEADDKTQRKWDRYILLITTLDSIDVSDTVVQALLALAVSEKLLDQKTVDAVTTTTGSYAEVLFGVGTIIRHQDVARALRGAATEGR